MHITASPIGNIDIASLWTVLLKPFSFRDRIGNEYLNGRVLSYDRVTMNLFRSSGFPPCASKARTPNSSPPKALHSASQNRLKRELSFLQSLVAFCQRARHRFPDCWSGRVGIPKARSQPKSGLLKTERCCTEQQNSEILAVYLFMALFWLYLVDTATGNSQRSTVFNF